MTTAYLGLDLGTSGLKAVLCADDGTVLAEAEQGYAVERPAPGWAQTPVPVWLDAVAACVQRMAPVTAQHTVAALGLAGQMHGLVLADESGTALTPGLLWPDGRASAQVGRWRSLPPAEQARLANPLVPGMTGPMLAWLVEHDPAAVSAARVALLPKDAVRAALVPGLVTDRSDASATLLWDVAGDGWSRAVLDHVGVPERLLPEVVPSDRVVGHTGWLADRPGGGPCDVAVVAGGADTPTARLPLAGTTPLQVNLGTGAQVIRPLDRPRPTGVTGSHLYADTGTGWYAMVALQNAGLALAWAAGVLDLSWEDLFAAAAQAPPAVGGVAFRPYLTPERGEVPRPHLGAGWVGADADTTRQDLAVAAVDGVLFTVAQAAHRLSPAGPADGSEPVLLTGGGGRPAVVRRRLADLLGRPVHTHRVRSASALGAAVLAARGVGHALAPQTPPVDEVEPGAGQARARAAFEHWRETVGA